jgi:guanosine-3',5'-bis(diphosphate) 3'-pyrophosphohydrolase
MSEKPILLLDALHFAAMRHRDQRRKGERGAPYVNHLIEVAHILAQNGIEDADTLCAAVLHDAIEDVDVSEDEVRARFGDRVAELVVWLTDPPELPFAERKQRQVDVAPNMPLDAQNIRVADKISNLRGILTSPPEDWSLERKLAYFAWSERVVAECTGASSELRRMFRDIYQSGAMALEVERLSRSRPRA